MLGIAKLVASYAPAETCTRWMHWMTRRGVSPLSCCLRDDTQRWRSDQSATYFLHLTPSPKVCDAFLPNIIQFWLYSSFLPSMFSTSWKELLIPGRVRKWYFLHFMNLKVTNDYWDRILLPFVWNIFMRIKNRIVCSPPCCLFPPSAPTRGPVWSVIAVLMSVHLYSQVWHCDQQSLVDLGSKMYF